MVYYGHDLYVYGLGRSNDEDIKKRGIFPRLGLRTGFVTPGLSAPVGAVGAAIKAAATVKVLTK